MQKNIFAKAYILQAKCNLMVLDFAMQNVQQNVRKMHPIIAIGHFAEQNGTRVVRTFCQTNMIGLKCIIMKNNCLFY